MKFKIGQLVRIVERYRKHIKDLQGVFRVIEITPDSYRVQSCTNKSNFKRGPERCFESVTTDGQLLFPFMYDE